MKFHQRKCPSCQSIEAEPEICSQPKAETAGWEDLRQSWAGFFKTKMFFTYVRCRRCGLLYCPTYFDGAQLAELYGSMADNTAGLGAERTNRTQAGYVQLIDGEASAGDFLELGPDIGLFTLAYAKRFDPGATRNYWLFEPNCRVHAELSGRMAGFRHKISTELTDLSAVPNRSLGAVVMIHVLDHLLDPVETLHGLKEKMRPGARIHIVTHNERSLLARGLGVRWPAYCLQHPQLFNPRSIGELLRAAGWRVESVKRTVNYFPAGYLAQHGLYALGLKASFLGRIPSPMVGLRLGNMLTSAKA